MPEADLLARFILGGATLLVASEWLTFRDSRTARAFFLSRAWLVLRYALIVATGALCILVLTHDWS